SRRPSASRSSSPRSEPSAARRASRRTSGRRMAEPEAPPLVTAANPLPEPGQPAVLLVDKPAGLTSFGVIRRLRRALGEKKIGHAGTLDPMATGLLIALVGREATRLQD